MAKTSKQLAELVSRMPDPDKKGMYCTDIDKEKIDAAIVQIHEGGRKNILGVIDMLVEPGKGDDVKAHYALHCLGLSICNSKDKAAKSQFSRVLASQIGGKRREGVGRFTELTRRPPVGPARS